jgi:hypothetical protein
MVIREDLEREEGAASGRPGGMSASPAGELGAAKGGRAADPAVAGFQKCPYLAGRPPCGSHHMFPSGTNVCWAGPDDEKPYRGVSRDTQAEHCFGGPEGLAGCSRYQHAVAQALPLPRFEPAREAASRGDWVVEPGHRPSHRRDEKRRARLIFHASWIAPLLLAGLLLALLLR